ncbi:hypothetical protein [Vagococcus fluvialis]|uniref:hypothetical protein n=1 Tax=Vagococcus fluvialis TaxID=2738 RepID=UPI003D0AB4B1
MKKLSSVLLLLSFFIVGCSKSDNSSTNNSTSESSKVEKEKEVFKLYGAEYNLSAKTFSVSGKTNIDNKVVAKKDGEEIGEVKVTASGSIEYVGEIPEKSFDIEFSDKTNSETVTIKSLSELEQEERDKQIAIAKEERKKADEEAAKIAKEEQEKKEKEAAIQKAKEELAAQYDTGITFDNLARNPDTYKGQKVKFYGKIVQVIKGDNQSQFRFAVDDNYDQMLYIEISENQLSNNRILDNDYITIKGTSYGEYTYSSTLGGEITVPAVVVDSFELNQ